MIKIEMSNKGNNFPIAKKHKIGIIELKYWTRIEKHGYAGLNSWIYWRDYLSKNKQKSSKNKRIMFDLNKIPIGMFYFCFCFFNKSANCFGSPFMLFWEEFIKFNFFFRVEILI